MVPTVFFLFKQSIEGNVANKEIGIVLKVAAIGIAVLFFALRVLKPSVTECSCLKGR